MNPLGRGDSGGVIAARPAEGWQSFIPASQGPNGREDSWGIYQLLKSHNGKPMGVGHNMLKETGLDPADPSNWQPSIDYAAKNGWSAWYGAKAKGVGPWDGIKGANAVGPQAAGVRPNPGGVPSGMRGLPQGITPEMLQNPQFLQLLQQLLQQQNAGMGGGFSRSILGR